MGNQFQTTNAYWNEQVEKTMFEFMFTEMT